MSGDKVVPYEVDVDLLDGALDALRALGPTGLGSIIHDQVPERERDLAWWVQEWGWTIYANGSLRGIYGDWTETDDDERFFTALAPYVRPGGYVICGDERGYGDYFAWVFEDGKVERRPVRLHREYEIEPSPSAASGDHRVRTPKPASAVRHGTISAYTNDRCRCDLCTWAWSARTRADRAEVLPAPPWFEAWAEATAGSL